MSEHNDVKKQNAKVQDGKAISKSPHIKMFFNIIILFLYVYVTVKNSSMHSVTVVTIIVFLNFVYNIVVDIRNHKKPKKQVVFEKNDEKALK